MKHPEQKQSRMIQPSLSPPTMKVSFVEPSPPEELLCPLTNSIMMQPILHPRYGYSCEQSAMEEWLSGMDQSTCPLTGLPIALNDFVPHLALKAHIMDWHQACLIAKQEIAGNISGELVSRMPPKELDGTKKQGTDSRPKTRRLVDDNNSTSLASNNAVAA